ncbi:6682_t:CDS:2 [Funneliformis mosseae]|uniref:6682_t:CDS:1 n=1 Tax=Funneliformis mosseae TaxID=27381 RepID=A0A9N9GN47_FUNMO|nr:6682_t:CDS:2 [Funneliformis mosseae]
MAKFRKFLISINYNRPIVASMDNIKLEEKLRYSASLSVILGSTLPLQETSVSFYNKINTIIKNIQTNNTIAKYVCVYILQVPVSKVLPFVLRIIPNNSENISDVYEIHNQVLEFAAHFKIYILSIGADGVLVEIKAQKCIMQTNTETKLKFTDKLYRNVNDLNSNLKIWPTDDEIRVLINDAYKEANALANDKIILLIKENLTKEFQDGEEVLTKIIEMIRNVASLNL